MNQSTFERTVEVINQQRDTTMDKNKVEQLLVTKFRILSQWPSFRTISRDNRMGFWFNDLGFIVHDVRLARTVYSEQDDQPINIPMYLRHYGSWLSGEEHSVHVTDGNISIACKVIVMPRTSPTDKLAYRPKDSYNCPGWTFCVVSMSSGMAYGNLLFVSIDLCPNDE